VHCGQHAFFSSKKIATVLIENSSIVIASHEVDTDKLLIKSEVLWSGVIDMSRQVISGEASYVVKIFKPAIQAAIQKYKDTHCNQAYYYESDNIR